MDMENRFDFVSNEYVPDVGFLYFFRDMKTGVIYVARDNNGGLCPLVDRDGKPVTEF